MKLSCFIVICLTLFCSIGLTGHAQSSRHRFALGDSVFLLDNKPFQIISGEMHYERIPYQYWRDRLHKAKAMGLNTVAVYCFWNMHEPEPGKFVFTGNEDVARFVRLAQAEGLWVILRPGPYVCAEWEFGGYPWWLLKDKGMIVRSQDPRFMAAAKQYIDALGKQLAPLQITHGGPIILTQVENEYGSFGNDKVYEGAIEKMIRDAGFDVPLFTADGDWLFQNAALPGVLPGGNGETNPQKLKELVNKYHDGKGPYFCPELYPGWLDHWGEPFQKVAAANAVKDAEGLLKAGMSLNFYMFHGGTNFGFMNGANYSKEHPIQPDITSYDYDAPLSEAGVPTEKYFALRKLILQYLPAGTKVPEPPAAPVFMSIPSFDLKESALLFDNLPRPVTSEHPLSMEELNQGYGYVLYRTQLPANAGGLLKINGLRDYGIVFIDGKQVAVLDRRLKQDSVEIHTEGKAVIDIFVENMGRINYGHEMVNNRKGITGEVQLGDYVLTGWKMYSLPFSKFSAIKFKKAAGVNASSPIIRKGIFKVTDPHDTFLDMRNWGKGAVWVNGHNLGRYWNIGPQQTLYLPGCWLKKGENEIIIFEELKPGINAVQSLDHPILDQLNK